MKKPDKAIEAQRNMKRRVLQIQKSSEGLSRQPPGSSQATGRADTQLVVGASAQSWTLNDKMAREPPLAYSLPVSATMKRAVAQ